MNPWKSSISIFVLAAVFLAVGNAVDAQAPKGKWLIKADEYFRDKEYAKAIEYYEWAARKDDSYRPLLGLGKTHRALKQYERAAEYFGMAAEKADAPPEACFFLGQCLLSQNEPDSAKHWFQAFAKRAPEDARAFNLDQWDALLANEPLKDEDFQYKKLRINSKHSDFSAYPVGEDLYFCSARPNETGVVHTSSADGGALVDLFIVRGYFDSTKSRRSVRPLSDLNTKFHEGPLCLSPDGNTIYFTRNDAGRKSDNPYSGTLNPLRIFKATAIESGWSTPVSLPFNSPDYAVGHPALSPDGKRLYFSSDKPGGQGGADIYYVEIQGESFGAVRNLGPAVNTPEDEVFPFVDSEGSLYFASSGHLGFGGLDIFRSQPKDASWTKPENLGLPVNSPQDDFAYVLDSSRSKGFFSSNRGNDPDNDDLYAFSQKLEEKRPEFQCAPQKENNYCYRFSEVGSMDLSTDLDTFAMAYIWTLGDGTKKYGLTVDHCFDGPGDYPIELNLVDTLSGFRFTTETSSILSIRDAEQLYISGPEAMVPGKELTLDASKSNLPGCEPEEYYWEIDGFPIGRGPEYKVTFPKAGVYSVKLGILGKGGAESPCEACVIKDLEVSDGKR